MDHPYLVQELATGKYEALKPYEPIDKGPAFTAGVLMTTPGCIEPTPTVLLSTSAEIEKTGVSELVAVYHLGDRLTGHQGVIHGGLLATLLDEALCRCGFPMLPHKVGVTASLNVDYQAPTPSNNYMLLKAATTSVDGRKVWVEGKTFALPHPEEFEPGQVLKQTMTAKVLVIEPSWYGELKNSRAVSNRNEASV